MLGGWGLSVNGSSYCIPPKRLLGNWLPKVQIMAFPMWSHHRHCLSGDTGSSSLWFILSSPWEIYSNMVSTHTGNNGLYIYWPANTALRIGQNIHSLPRTWIQLSLCPSQAAFHTPPELERACHHTLLYFSLWIPCPDNESTVWEIHMLTHACSRHGCGDRAEGLSGWTPHFKCRFLSLCNLY